MERDAAKILDITLYLNNIRASPPIDILQLQKHQHRHINTYILPCPPPFHQQQSLLNLDQVAQA